jgi:hypothetical protein
MSHSELSFTELLKQFLSKEHVSEHESQLWRLLEAFVPLDLGAEFLEVQAGNLKLVGRDDRVAENLLHMLDLFHHLSEDRLSLGLFP